MSLNHHASLMRVKAHLLAAMSEIAHAQSALHLALVVSKSPSSDADVRTTKLLDQLQQTGRTLGGFTREVGDLVELLPYTTEASGKPPEKGKGPR